jgi:hypothetical protein
MIRAAIAICALLALPQARSHHHPNAEQLSGNDRIREFSMRDTVLARETKKANLLTSRGRRFDAFTTGEDTLLFVTDHRTGRTRVIRGLPFSWRPFSNLTWADSRTLMFDRWSSPRVGMHYAVDVIDGKLIAAMSFHET